jgi:hypothetical protein
MTFQEYDGARAIMSRCTATLVQAALWDEFRRWGLWRAQRLHAGWQVTPSIRWGRAARL